MYLHVDESPPRLLDAPPPTPALASTKLEFRLYDVLLHELNDAKNFKRLRFGRTFVLQCLKSFAQQPHRYAVPVYHFYI